METNKKFYLKSLLRDFLKAIPAGISISLGCVAFLSCGNKIAGSLFFTLGLFIILNFNLNLFTGKVCYAPDNKLCYVGNLACIWLGNLVGAVASGLVLNLTRLNSLKSACEIVCNTKLNDSLLSVFILGILCNILIFLAVYGFKNFNFDLGKYLALFFGVSVFVLCGFEHCVANMFYFTFALKWSWKTIIYLLVMTAGNIVGGIGAYLVLAKRKKD